MFMHDLRIALRTLAHSPGYTIVALVTLILGIGANTSVFSIVNGVLITPLGFADEDRLVRLSEVNSKGRVMQNAWRNFVDWRDQARSFESLVAHTPAGESTVLGAGAPLRTNIAGVSNGFFRTLRAEPLAGRTFTADEHRKGGEPAVIVSEAFWRSHLGARPDFTSHILTVAGFRTRIVGVMPTRFDYPGAVDIWFPIELDEDGESRTAHNYDVLGRLRAGVTFQQANAELNAITRRFLESEPAAGQEQGFENYFPRSVLLLSLRETLVGNTRRPLLILLGAALLVLLVACTNLASTTLARGTAREHEYAIRHALGAGRARMIRVLFAETLSLSLIGALLGLVFAAFVLRLLPVLAPEGVPRLDEVRLDLRVAAFTVLLSLLAAVLSGVLPGLRVSASALRSLRGGARTGDPAGRINVWKSLIACEVALALLLLVGSGLLLRSFWTVLAIEPGFATRRVLTATVNPPSAKYDNNNSKRLYYDALLQRIEALPGVQAAGLALAAPMSWIPNGLVEIDDAPQPNLSAEYQLVSPGYFKALGIPLLSGRMFDERDHHDAQHVALVNQTFAEEAWPGENPIGKRITGGGMDDYWDQKTWATVIGITGTIRQRDLTRSPRATLYFSYRQRPFRAWSMTAVAQPRTGAASSLTSGVRDAVRSVDADVPIHFATMEERVSQALAPRRFVLTVILAFAVVALTLASVGVFGVVAYAVERRRQEIGIRLAIGAQPASVRRMLQREYMTAALIGAGAGTLLALAFTRLLAGLLFEIKPNDPPTFAAVVLLMCLVAWAASLIPAIRSTRTNPLHTMRT
jgi:predicted permease